MDLLEEVHHPGLEESVLVEEELLDDENTESGDDDDKEPLVEEDEQSPEVEQQQQEQQEQPSTERGREPEVPGKAKSAKSSGEEEEEEFQETFPKQSMHVLTEVRVERGPQVAHINTTAQLDSLLNKHDNLVVLLHVSMIEYSLMASYALAQMGPMIHETNGDRRNYVPFTVAVMDVLKHKEDLEKYTRLFPTKKDFDQTFDNSTVLLVQRMGEPIRFAGSRMPMDMAALSTLLAKQMGDPSLLPMEDPWLTRMNTNANPDFVYFYSEHNVLIPRFRHFYSSTKDMIDLRDGDRTVGWFLLSNPHLMERGLAVSVNKMDRPDISTASIADVGEDKMYGYRYSDEWMQAHLNNTAGTQRASNVAPGTAY
jgi:hypothetical protein